MIPYDEMASFPKVATWQWVVCIGVWLFASYGLLIGLFQVYRSLRRGRQISQVEKFGRQ